MLCVKCGKGTYVQSPGPRKGRRPTYGCSKCGAPRPSNLRRAAK